MVRTRIRTLSTAPIAAGTALAARDLESDQTLRVTRVVLTEAHRFDGTLCSIGDLVDLVERAAAAETIIHVTI